MSDEQDEDGVGYGQPPKSGRFKPGQSGNPAGRPKGSKNKRRKDWTDLFADMVLEEGDRTVKVREDGNFIDIEVSRAITRSIAHKAAKGDHKSQRLFTELTNKAAAHQESRKMALLEAALDYKNKCEAAFRECDEKGVPRPDFVPHPDDIYIDPETGDVLLTGPLTRQQRDAEDKAEINAFEREIEDLQAILDDTEDPKLREMAEADLTNAEAALETLRTLAARNRI